MSGLSTTAHIPPLFDDDKSFGEPSAPTVGSTTANTITIRPDSRICLLGTRGSGKTCFIGGLAILDRLLEQGDSRLLPQPASQEGG